MDSNEFQSELRSFLDDDNGSLIEVIPGGSGICHISNVGLTNWDPGFVSTNPGRWTQDGQPSKYFADDFNVCLAELGYSSDAPGRDTVFELWQTCDDSNAINITKLPDYLRAPLYEDRGSPPIKWQKSHILLREVRNTPDYELIGCVYAPSASGTLIGIGGMCFVANPYTDHIERIATKTYADWVDTV